MGNAIHREKNLTNVKVLW